MTIPAPQDRVKLYLRAIDDFFAGAEKLVTNARQQQMRKARQWPSYTFLPVGTWERIGEQTFQIDPMWLYEFLNPLAALGAWRYTKGIYVFEPDMYAALMAKPFEGKPPLDALTRLPEWCLYIDTPGMKWREYDLGGVFVFLAWDAATGATGLTFVQDVGETVENEWNARLHFGFNMLLGDWTLRDAIVLSDFHWIADWDTRYLYKDPNRKLTKADMNLIMPLMISFYAWEPRTKEQEERIIANRLKDGFSGQTTEDGVRREYEKERAEGKEKQKEIDAAFNNGMTLLDLARIMQDKEDTDDTMNCIGQLMPLILYICSEAPDISSGTPGHYPKNPKPKKINRQLILEQPEHPTVWHVGKTIRG